jgi:SAM-dependent methyltransferase
MTMPLVLYGAALRRAAAGRPAGVDILGPAGTAVGLLDASTWAGGLIHGDSALLARCRRPILDIGCGPGRLVAALRGAGMNALGVDVSPEAVRQARRRGARAVRADVFGPVPWEGAWRTVLLIDGNIGIGGNPHRLLRRCVALLHPAGTVLAELRPPGEPSWSGDVVLRDSARCSAPFPWAAVAADRISPVAWRAGLCVKELWTEGDRWFAEMTIR